MYVILLNSRGKKHNPFFFRNLSLGVWFIWWEIFLWFVFTIVLRTKGETFWNQNEQSFSKPLSSPFSVFGIKMRKAHNEKSYYFVVIVSKVRKENKMLLNISCLSNLAHRYKCLWFDCRSPFRSQYPIWKNTHIFSEEERETHWAIVVHIHRQRKKKKTNFVEYKLKYTHEHWYD